MRILSVLVLIVLSLCPAAQAQDQMIRSIAYSKDGDMIALSYLDFVDIFEVHGTELGDLVQQAPAIAADFDSAAWNPLDNNLLATVDAKYKTVVLWDFSDRSHPKSSLLATIEADYIDDFIWTPDGTRVILRYWSPSEAKSTNVILSLPDYASNQIDGIADDEVIFAISPEGRYALVFSTAYDVLKIQTLTPSNAPIVKPLPYLADLIAFDDTILAFSDEIGNLYIQDIASCLEHWYERLGDDYTWVRDLALRPGRTQIAVIMEGPDQIYLLDWVAKTHLEIPITSMPDYSAIALAWSPDGRYLAYGDAELKILDLAEQEPSFTPATPRIVCDFAPMNGYDLNEAIRHARDWNSPRTICLAKDTIYTPYITNVDSSIFDDNEWKTGLMQTFGGEIRVEGNGAVLDLELPKEVDVQGHIVDTTGFNAWSINAYGELSLFNLTIRNTMSDEYAGINNSGNLVLQDVVFEEYGATNTDHNRIILQNDSNRGYEPPTVCANRVIFRNDQDLKVGTAILNNGGRVTVTNSVFEGYADSSQAIVEETGTATTDLRNNWWGTAEGLRSVWSGQGASVGPGVLFEPFATEPFEWYKQSLWQNPVP